VDTVGCGDSFTAAIAFGFLHDLPAVSTLNAVGAATATGCGAGRNVAYLDKVLQLLREANLNEANLNEEDTAWSVSVPSRSVPSHADFRLRQGAERVFTCCHVSCSPESSLSVEMGSGTATRPTASDLGSLSRRALALPRVPQPRTSPTCLGGLRRCHVSYGSESRLPVEEGSSAAMCSTASNPASLQERAQALPRVPQFHVGRGASSIKKGLAGLAMQLDSCVSKDAARLMCFQGALTCFQDTCA
jgi:hypothetical protein